MKSICPTTFWPNINDQDRNAASSAVPIVGEFIEKIGKTDLSEYSREEFEVLILKCVHSYEMNHVPF